MLKLRLSEGLDFDTAEKRFGVTKDDILKKMCIRDSLLSALTATRELFLILAKECASAYGYTTGIPEIDS